VNGSGDSKMYCDCSPVAHGKLYQAIASHWCKVAELAVDINITHIVALRRERGVNVLSSKSLVSRVV
jgi:hypothetical protein